MINIQNFLKNNILLADGAFGTYISSFIGRNSQPCELLNITNPELVLRTHEQYVKAGAKIILTNTFSASIAGKSLGGNFDTTEKIVNAGVNLAVKAAGETAFVAADIGPLPEASASVDVLETEYHRIINTFLASGIDIFVFETFPSADFPIKLAKYIKLKSPQAFIIISFAVLPDGFSREGVKGQGLIDKVKNAGCVDSAGFNCCSGPAHLLNFAKKVDFGNLIPIIMPNAGYPQRVIDDISPKEANVAYSGTPEYFAEKLSEAVKNGFRIIGGCCGTTPRHIELLSCSLKNADKPLVQPVNTSKEKSPKHFHDNKFSTVLASDKKALIVELDPPFNSDISKIKEAAALLKSTYVDAITIADSPMARSRADSVIIAAHLKREIGIEAIPHICCRDKNINAIKSSLIAAHIEGIRNVLAITGDPVPDTDRGSVKSVFNFNSVGLCKFIKSLDSDIFKGDKISCGCAFNVNVRNIGVELARLEKKVEAGASFVLTQPVFTQEAIDAIIEARKIGAKVIAGIFIPVSYKNAIFLANEMPGFSIPEKYIKRFDPDMTREEGEKVGIEISAEIMEMVSPATDGFYLMVPFNRAPVAKQLIELAKKRGII